MIRDYTGHESGVHLLSRDNFMFIRTGGTVEKNQATSMLERLLDEILPRRVHIMSDGKSADTIQYHHRTDEKHRIFFFANRGNSPVTTQIFIPASDGHIEKWDLETGKRTPLVVEPAGEMSRINLSFDRLQSHMIVTSPGHPKKEKEEPLVETLKLNLTGHWKVDPEEDNALRLDKFKRNSTRLTRAYTRAGINQRIATAGGPKRARNLLTIQKKKRFVGTEQPLSRTSSPTNYLWSWIEVPFRENIRSTSTVPNCRAMLFAPPSGSITPMPHAP